MRIPLNPYTSETGLDGRSRRFVATLNAAGRPVVEPAVQRRGSHLAINPAVFARDLYGDFPADAKATLPAALSLLTA